jgi:hypothetical protein
MSLRFVCCLSALSLALAPALGAKTVYIPLTGQDFVGSLPLEVRVVVSNHGTTPATLKHLFLAVGTDGTLRSAPAPSQEVAAGQTIVLTRPASQVGLFELSGPDALAYSAQLAVVGDSASFLALPVLSAKNVYPANDSVDLLGLPRGAAQPTDLTLVNIGFSAATCSASIHGADGGAIGSTAKLALAPLSQQQHDDVLADLTGTGDVRIKISCDQPFFASALVGGQPAAERLSLFTPGKRAIFGISHGAGAPVQCPAGASCFDRPGVVHVPSPAVPVKRLTFPVPAGSYRRLHLRIDVKHGGWASSQPNGRHNLFWLVKNRNLFMYGNGDLYGPSANYLDIQHGVDLVHEAKVHLVQQPFVAQPGATYHFDYVYDAGARFLELVVTQGGAQVARLRGVPNVSQINVAAGDEIILDLGFDGSNPAEPPTYNWLYQNIELDFVP